MPQGGYMGNMLTKEAGYIGGNITRRLVQIAEQQLAGGAGMSASAGTFGTNR
jgi:hypothetical protein